MIPPEGMSLTIGLRLKQSASVGEKENEAFVFASRWRGHKIRATASVCGHFELGQKQELPRKAVRVGKLCQQQHISVEKLYRALDSKGVWTDCL